MKKVLVIGGGGREHAIVDALSRSPQVDKIYAIPGNAGIAAQATCVKIGECDFPAIIDFVKSEGIDLTVVGPRFPFPRESPMSSRKKASGSSDLRRLRQGLKRARISRKA